MHMSSQLDPRRGPVRTGPDDASVSTPMACQGLRVDRPT